MNITSIIDNGYSLILVQDINTNVIIDKAQIKLELVGTIVRLYDNSTSNQANQFAQVQQYNLDFSKIINPVTPDAKTLEANISTLINTIPAPAPPPPPDYSTATNQLVQISQQDDGTPFLSVFRDSTVGGKSVFKEYATVNENGAFIDNTSGLSWLRFLKLLQPFTKQFVINIFRPANIIPYTIGDAINNGTNPSFIKIAQACDTQGTTQLVSITIRDTSNQAVKPQFNFFFFRGQPPTQIDNTPINISDAFMNTDFIGAINGSSMSTVLSPNTSQGNSIQMITPSKPLGMQSSSEDIWVVIGLNNAYIPTSAETFTFEFKFLS